MPDSTGTGCLYSPERLALYLLKDYRPGMGFYVTESYQMEADPLPKNRVWGFRDPSTIHARRFPSQVVEPHQEAVTLDSSTVSGVGEWLSNDPIGISGGLNQYVFCANNPVNFRDPFGLCEKSTGMKIKDGILKFINIPPEFFTLKPIPADVWFPWMLTEGPFHIAQVEKTALVGFSYPFGMAGATVFEVVVLPVEPFAPDLQQYNAWKDVHEGYVDVFKHIWRNGHGGQPQPQH